jgi:hypothetical protein
MYKYAAMLIIDLTIFKIFRLMDYDLSMAQALLIGLTVGFFCEWRDCDD